MKNLVRGMAYLFAFMVPVFALAGIGYLSGMEVAMGGKVPLVVSGQGNYIPKPFDPTKPTVAILLGDSFTEVTDFMIPYEIFSAAEGFNVYGVASERRLTTLTGGLDVMPDYTFDELEELIGKSPDIIVVPAIMGVQEAENRPIFEWLQHQATNDHTLLFSICTGAEVLAVAGLLDGRTATTHWAEIDGLEQQYPKVEWVRGLRYVETEKVITSAGITSGIDAALRIVANYSGVATAERIATELHYPHFEFVTQPQVEQYGIAPDDAIYLFNAAFYLNRTSDGVLLYPGVGEIELASVFDTYPASFTTRLHAIAPQQASITTKHGLHLFPRYDYQNTPTIQRLLVPGEDAYSLAATETTVWGDEPKSVPLIYVHADLPERFAFEAPLLDLARTQNIPTAEMAAKRLEYRPTTMVLTGENGWGLLLLIPFGIGLGGVLLLMVWKWIMINRNNQRVLVEA
jgi:AraC family transcriptional activator FtrA